jgi:hypothetical protein
MTKEKLQRSLRTIADLAEADMKFMCENEAYPGEADDAAAALSYLRHEIVPSIGDRVDVNEAREWAEGLAEFIDEMMPHGESSVEALPWKQTTTNDEE